MKPKLLLLCALVAFFAGIGLLVSAWNGNSSVTAAWPISSSVVKLSGSSSGWRAMAGIAALLGAPLLFVWSLINMATGGWRSSQKEPLPEPAPEVKKEAAPQ